MDLELIFLILNIFISLLGILTIYKPITFIIGFSIVGVMLIPISNNELSEFMMFFSVIMIFIYSCCLILGFARNKGM